MTLHELLEMILERGLLTPSRIPPMRTAVKQYAVILGVDAAHCTPDLYHLSPQALTALIDSKAPASLGTHALRNVKNNVRWLLRQGEALHLIPTLDMPLKSWREVRQIHTGWKVNRGERLNTHAHPYALQPLPPTLAAEFQAFSAWSTADFAPDRDARVRKRESTIVNYEHMLWRLAGYAHHIEGMPAEALTLQVLTEPAFATRFIGWWIARRGKTTITIHHDLARLAVIAQHWLKDSPRAVALHKLRTQLPHPEAIHNKRTRWLSLSELEAVGCSRYPLNSRRQQEIEPSRHVAKRLAQGQSPAISGKNRRRYALYVCHSLMLRLLVRIPIRLRNLVEMKLGHNLRQLPIGTWELTFTGKELKIGWRHGRTHQVSYTFPAELQPLLEEWLTVWRPLLLTDASVNTVFLTEDGEPQTVRTGRYAIETTTWRFTGVAVNPHTIRDIWATEYIKATKDIPGAAYMLGNTVQMVLKHYAHLLDAEAEQRASSWLQSQLNRH